MPASSLCLPYFNPRAAEPFQPTCREENLPGVTCFTEARGGLSYSTAMAPKIYPSSSDPKADVVTDYALIATGVAAALIALVYLILT
jgi:hypothetical protein